MKTFTIQQQSALKFSLTEEEWIDIPYENDLLTNHYTYGYDKYTPDPVVINTIGTIQWFAHSAYELIPEAIHDNFELSFTGEEVMLSDDNGVTYKYRNKWKGRGRVEMSHIFHNGAVMWATSYAIFYSDDFLATIKQSTILNSDGTPYVCPLPNSNNFREIMVSDRVYRNGVEMYVWGNYCNVNDGNSPVNVYYTIDCGATIKVCYTFGVNYGYGDPLNPLTVRHIHVINYNYTDNYWVMQTGDGLVVPVLDCRWMKGVYNEITDTWVWTQIANGTAASHYKSCGMAFLGDDFFFASDCTGDITKQIVYRGKSSDVGNPALYVKVHNSLTWASSMTYYFDGYFVLAKAALNVVIYSKDYGVTWVEVNLNDALFPPGESFIKFTEKNTNGWIKANYTSATNRFRMGNALMLKI